METVMNSLRLRILVGILGVISIVLLVNSPIEMGRTANRDIPVIGQLEAMSESYCSTTLSRATQAYIACKVIDRVVSTVQRTELSFTPFGIGLVIAPGELLAAANDAIERLCTAFFLVIGLTLVGQMASGMLTFLCVKFFLPLSVASLVLFCLSPRYFAWARALGELLFKTALMAYLFFPALALATEYLNSHYLDSVYAENIQQVESGAKKLEQDEKDVTTLPTQQLPKEAGWWESTMTKVRSTLESVSIEGIKTALVAKLDSMWNAVDNMTDKLFAILTIFMLTTCVLPVAVFWFMTAIMRIFVDQYRNSSHYRSLEELIGKMPLKKA